MMGSNVSMLSTLSTGSGVALIPALCTDLFFLKTEQPHQRHGYCEYRNDGYCRGSGRQIFAPSISHDRRSKKRKYRIGASWI
jgi:hypothetical protein